MLIQSIKACSPSLSPSSFSSSFIILQIPFHLLLLHAPPPPPSCFSYQPCLLYQPPSYVPHVNRKNGLHITLSDRVGKSCQPHNWSYFGGRVGQKSLFFQNHFSNIRLEQSFPILFPVSQKTLKSADQGK